MEAKVQLTREVVLKRATFQRKKVELDYHRNQDANWWNIEGRWGKYSRSDNFTVGFAETDGLTEKLVEAISRRLRLEEVHELKIQKIQIDIGAKLDHRDWTTHLVTLWGVGRHSKVMWDPSEFNCDCYADEQIGAYFSALLRDNMSIEIEDYPLKEH